jgi:OPT family small oligopeptide transporter
MISFIGSPLVTPWWSQANTGIAFLIIYWCIAPLLYFSNVANLAYFPISSYLAFDNTGSPYDPTKVLTDGVFDAAKYSAYSPVFISTTLLLAYGVNFGIFTSVIMHTFLWFRKDIVRRFRTSLKDEKDLHSRLMLVYPEVPQWWYITVGVLAMICVLVAVEIFPTKLPVWAVFFAAGISSLVSIPLAMLQAITNQQMPTQVLSEMIGGYLVPGKPIANVIFKTLGFLTSGSAVSFAADLKLGHYMKIPPRIMFMVQVIGTVISCIWVCVIQDWMLTNVEGICTRQQRQGFICPGSTTFFTSSVIWGAIGPRELFNPGKVYSPVLLFFLFGLLAPIPFYVLARRYPLSIWRYINIPVFFAGLSAMPPASGINFISWLIVGFLFNYFVRRFHFRWWMRYNYILSAGLDAGVIFGMAVIFFTLGISRPGGININWWGNLVWTNTADANGIPLKPLPASGIIGPSSW